MRRTHNFKYTTKEIIDLTGAERSQLNHWIDCGIVEPKYNEKGRGSSRRFGLQGLAETRLCVSIKKLSLPTPLMKRIINSVFNPPEPRRVCKKDFMLVVQMRPKQACTLCDKSQMLDLIDSCAVVVNLSETLYAEPINPKNFDIWLGKK